MRWLLIKSVCFSDVCNQRRGKRNCFDFVLNAFFFFLFQHFAQVSKTIIFFLHHHWQWCRSNVCNQRRNKTNELFWFCSERIYFVSTKNGENVGNFLGIIKFQRFIFLVDIFDGEMKIGLNERFMQKNIVLTQKSLL